MKGLGQNSGFVDEGVIEGSGCNGFKQCLKLVSVEGLGFRV